MQTQWHNARKHTCDMGNIITNNIIVTIPITMASLTPISKTEST
jgi:hypothetical protein